jgi:isopentenyl diphosphate isomerase/L-lactate dehydrogenase-like FMN-dependent dehydrogenase
MGTLMAGAPFAPAFQGPAAHQPRRAPLDELVNLLEFEDEARRVLAADVYASLADNGRDAFDFQVLRPRMLVNCVDLDLTVDLFGQKMFTPIVVGPIGQQRDFHAEGELATARGSSAAQTVMVVSSRASHPIERIVSETKIAPWYQVYADGDLAAARAQAQ